MAGRGLVRWGGWMVEEGRNECVLRRKRGWPSLNRSVRIEVEKQSVSEKKKIERDWWGERGGLVGERENAGVAPLVKEK